MCVIRLSNSEKIVKNQYELSNVHFLRKFTL